MGGCDMNEIIIGARVERLDGGYTKGRKGTVIELSDDGSRARILWDGGHPKTWVRLASLRVIKSGTVKGPWVPVKLRGITHARVCRNEERGEEWHEYKHA
jgi:hypothetical protein